MLHVYTVIIKFINYLFVASVTYCSIVKNIPATIMFFVYFGVNLKVSILYEHDVGRFLEQPPQNGEKLFKDEWTLDSYYKFSTRTERRFSTSLVGWKYDCLVFPDYLNGALCKVCVLLGISFGRTDYHRFAVEK